MGYDCNYTPTLRSRSANCMNLHFAPPDTVVLKDDNWYQTLN